MLGYWLGTAPPTSTTTHYWQCHYHRDRRQWHQLATCVIKLYQCQPPTNPSQTDSRLLSGSSDALFSRVSTVLYSKHLLYTDKHHIPLTAVTSRLLRNRFPPGCLQIFLLLINFSDTEWILSYYGSISKVFLKYTIYSLIRSHHFLKRCSHCAHRTTALDALTHYVVGHRAVCEHRR